MIKNVSFNNNYKFLPPKKQEKNYVADIANPSPSVSKAVFFGASKKLFNKSDIAKSFDALDLSSAEKQNKYCKQIRLLARKKLGIDINLPSIITGARFQKELYEWLELYKKLEMPLPERIVLLEDRWKKNKEGKNTGIVISRCKTSQDKNDKIIYSEIQINKNVFSEDFLNFSKLKSEREFLNKMHRSFYHEIVHLQHIHVKEEFTKILNESELKTFCILGDLVEKYFVGLNKKSFDLKADYNLQKIENNWEKLNKAIATSIQTSKEFKKDFNENFMNKLNPIMTKLFKTKKLIKENLSNYALKNCSETIAESGEAEFMKGPVENAELRALLKKLGKIDSKMFSEYPKKIVEEKRAD